MVREGALRPRLVSRYFDGGDGCRQWSRLARVLEYSARRHCQGWEIDIQPVTVAPLKSALGIPSHAHNTSKMEEWSRAVREAQDGARLILLDTDTMIVNALDDVWDMDFDFAHTTKPSRFPFNSGVVFVRVSERTRAFFRLWRDENVRLLGDRVAHRPWRQKYGGINQAALGYALESGLTQVMAMADLPCVYWNCEDSSWQAFDAARTRIVHVKSALRLNVFRHSAAASPAIRTLARIWHDFEREVVKVVAAG